MNKTMTANEVRALICGNLSVDQENLLEALIDKGVIAPDPEPRPDFSRLTWQELCDWIDDHNEGKENIRIHALTLHFDLCRLANYIADRKGMK